MLSYINERITIDEELCNGRPTIRGMRITVQTIIEFLLAGDTEENILAQYPMLVAEDLEACRKFAMASVIRSF